MGELAKSLNVKTASLYNHVESLDALFTEVGLAAVSKMVASEAQAIKGKEKNDALFAIAAAYRAFAKDHNELYRVIMSLQKSKKRSVGTGGRFRLLNLFCRCSPAMGSA
jgi:AcrR family transcriptional regulator